MGVKQIVYKRLNEIKPYPNNPRNNDNAVEAVANSIKRFNFQNPIIVDSDGVIVAGHTRYKAAKKLGLKTVPCLVADDLNEEQINAFRLADNKVGELATWDLDTLKVELDNIGEIDMSEFGFSLDGIGEEPQEVQEDDFDEEPPEEPTSKLGDIYQLGEHRLMCGDSTNAEHVARLMDGAKADMVFTDPPYNVNYADKNIFLNNADKGNRIQDDIENDHAGSDETAKNNLWLPAFKNMVDNSADDCSIYVTMPQGGAHMMMMMMSAQEAGWQVKHELIWVKNNHVLGRVDYLYKHEPLLFGWKDKHKFYGNGEHTKSVWEIPKPQKSDLHPTMKPIALIANALLNSSKEGDNILDVFGGSGSTLIACEQLNRKCYMMEMSPKYVDVIIKRWQEYTGKKAVKIT